MAMIKKTSLLATQKLEKVDTAAAGRIGARLRASRRQKNMTLDELAEATGLNKGFLSRIEKDAKAPSIATVIKLSRALDIPVARLFGEQIGDSDIHLVRTANHKPEDDPVNGYSFIPLSPAGSDRRNETFLMAPPRHFSEATHAEHAGEEMLYVLAGRIEVKFVDRSVAMSTGDYLQFPGHLVHHVRRIGANATVLIVISRD
ncbi:transcriptional regulator, XRE family with cupin sensor [Bradyrhizobium sp. Rc3b]|uniref:helix-turn-helix domain-containing protein n=1 Tax=Bradyrhizobium sp. Rc3b TaxID=1855322 RepID=UPI0008E93FB4|nr:XRE family transcriptional regulator [Bradyrhizobium sp. Rc3b]SFN83005.1 transcriptional regulator, XRE family with cupin sensor [Bradyrhizobium sp. Rc3b]